MRQLHVPHLQDDATLHLLNGPVSYTSLTAVILLVCIGLVLGSTRHEDVETDPDDVPAICSDIVPRELLLTDPASAKQCSSLDHASASKVKQEDERATVVLEWDTTADAEDTVVDIELYSIQKQNGTYRVHSLPLLRDVDNTGHIELPSWTPSALGLLKGNDLLFRIVETSSLERNSVSSRDLRTFVLILDRCPTLVHVTRRDPKPKPPQDDQFSFKVNIKPPPKVAPKEEQEVKKTPPPQEDEKSLELSFGGSKDSITLQVNSGGETVSVKVGAKEKTVSVKVDSKIKMQATAHAGKLFRRSKLERGSSLSDGFEEIEDYLAHKEGIMYEVSEEDANDGMVQRALKKLRSSYELTKVTVRQWRDYAKARTKQYVEDTCQNWYKNELKDPPTYEGLPSPPCNLAEAIGCPHFNPDTACNNGRGYCHFFHRGAYHCIRSVNASATGSGEQACYDQSGRLLEFENGGGTFDKAHPEGYVDIDFSTFPPNVKVLKLWRISHLVEDVWPFLLCCKFSNHCDWYSQVRPTRLSCKHYEIDPMDSRLNHKGLNELRKRYRV